MEIMNEWNNNNDNKVSTNYVEDYPYRNPHQRELGEIDVEAIDLLIEDLGIDEEFSDIITTPEKTKVTPEELLQMDFSKIPPDSIEVVKPKTFEELGLKLEEESSIDIYKEKSPEILLEEGKVLDLPPIEPTSEAMNIQFEEDVEDKEEKIIIVDADSIFNKIVSVSRKLLSFDSGAIGDFCSPNGSLLPIYVGSDMKEMLRDGRIVYLLREEFRKAIIAYVNRILINTSATKTYLVFSRGLKQNFRYKVYPEYKANRRHLLSYVNEKAYKIPQPQAFYRYFDEVIDEIEKESKGSIVVQRCIEWEADDQVIALSNLYPDSLVCCIDKDVHSQLVGREYYYDYSTKLMVKIPKRKPHQAFLNACKQCLVGDTSDNIKGVYGIGQLTVDQHFEYAKHDKRKMWEVVLDKFPKEKLAIATMQCINMHQLEAVSDSEFKLNLWTPEEFSLETHYGGNGF